MLSADDSWMNYTFRLAMYPAATPSSTTALEKLGIAFVVVFAIGMAIFLVMLYRKKKAAFHAAIRQRGLLVEKLE